MISDRQALDEIANILCEPEWDIAVSEWIADIVGRTERPHPGGHETRDEYAELFMTATGRDVIEGDDPTERGVPID